MVNRKPATTPSAGRQRARRLVPVLGLCAECEVAPATERHHWDGDALNNTANVIPVCRRCHMRLDGRLEAVRPYLALGRNKTHCKRGHPYTPENTYTNPTKGYRVCLTCKREYERARWPLRRRR